MKSFDGAIRNEDSNDQSYHRHFSAADSFETMNGIVFITLNSKGLMIKLRLQELICLYLSIFK